MPAPQINEGVLGPLGRLFDDPRVSEVFLAPSGRLTVCHDGQRRPVEPALFNSDSAGRWTSRLCEALGQSLDRDHPRVSVVIGSFHVEIAGPPVSPKGPLVLVSRFEDRSENLRAVFDAKVIDAATTALLIRAMHARMSAVFVGAAGSERRRLLRAVVRSWSERMRVAWVGGREPLGSESGGDLVRLDGPGGLQTALTLGSECIVADAPAPHEICPLLLSGRPVLLSLEAATVGAALRRLEALALVGHPGLTSSGAEAMILSSVDLFVAAPQTGKNCVVGEPHSWSRELGIRTIGEGGFLKLDGTTAGKRLGDASAALSERYGLESASDVSLGTAVIARRAADSESESDAGSGSGRDSSYSRRRPATPAPTPRPRTPSRVEPWRAPSSIRRAVSQPRGRPLSAVQPRRLSDQLQGDVDALRRSSPEGAATALVSGSAPEEFPHPKGRARTRPDSAPFQPDPATLERATRAGLESEPPVEVASASAALRSHTGSRRSSSAHPAWSSSRRAHTVTLNSKGGSSAESEGFPEEGVSALDPSKALRFLSDAEVEQVEGADSGALSSGAGPSSDSSSSKDGTDDP